MRFNFSLPAKQKKAPYILSQEIWGKLYISTNNTKNYVIYVIGADLYIAPPTSPKGRQIKTFGYCNV